MKGSRHRVHNLRGSIKSLARSIGRRNKNAIVKKVMKNNEMKRKMIKKVGEVIKKEMKNTCLLQSKSVFKDKQLSQIESFDWVQCCQ